MLEDLTFNPASSEKTLLPHHREKLDQIAPEVQQERGYRSVKDPAELETYDIHDSLWQGTPSLVIPVQSFGAQTPNFYLSQPDVPPDPALLRKGHPRHFGPVPESAYLTKPALCLDQHPRSRVLQRDRDLPTLISESILCGDAAVSRGVPAINLMGICNWQKYYLSQSKNPLADWMGMLLNRNGVYIALGAHYERPYNERQNLASLVRFSTLR